jgi:hypothetical protein
MANMFRNSSAQAFVLLEKLEKTRELAPCESETRTDSRFSSIPSVRIDKRLPATQGKEE